MQSHPECSDGNILHSSKPITPFKRILNRINANRRFDAAMVRCAGLSMWLALFLFKGIKMVNNNWMKDDATEWR